VSDPVKTILLVRDRVSRKPARQPLRIRLIDPSLAAPDRQALLLTEE